MMPSSSPTNSMILEQSIMSQLDLSDVDDLNSELSTPVLSDSETDMSEPMTPNAPPSTPEPDQESDFEPEQPSNRPSASNPSRLNPLAPEFVPQSQSRNDEFFDMEDLLGYCRSISGIENRILKAFQEEVENNPQDAFRRGPSYSTISKARFTLATLYQRLARSIRNLGFDEHTIVVPPEVREASRELDTGFHPYHIDNWRVGPYIYETKTKNWFGPENQAK